MNSFDTRERILYFHSLMERAYSAVPEDQRMIKSIIRALLNDYDRLFQPNKLKNPRIELTPLIQEHCHPWPGCPICGSDMVLRSTRNGDRQFYGCSTYPDCRGGRGAAEPHTPTMNDSLMLFLTAKEAQAKIEEEQRQSERFLNLDL